MCESLHRKKVVWFWIYEEHLLLKHWCDFDTNQVEVCPFLELTKLTGHFIWTSFGKMVMPKFWLRKKEIIKYTVYSLHYMLVERNFLWLTRTANSGLFFRKSISHPDWVSPMFSKRVFCHDDDIETGVTMIGPRGLNSPKNWLQLIYLLYFFNHNKNVQKFKFSKLGLECSHFILLHHHRSWINKKL